MIVEFDFSTSKIQHGFTNRSSNKTSSIFTLVDVHLPGALHNLANNFSYRAPSPNMGTERLNSRLDMPETKSDHLSKPSCLRYKKEMSHIFLLKRSKSGLSDEYAF